MKKTFLVKKPSDFYWVVKWILENVTGQKSLIIALSGNLGVGKTTFVQELGKVMGVKEVITSPTFTIMKKYSLENNQYDELVHLDLYRFESVAETKPIRLEELFTKPRTIVCVEWPEIINSEIFEPNVSLDIDIGSGEERNVVTEVNYKKQT